MLRYYITDGTATSETLRVSIQRAIDAGVGLVQIRQKDWSARALMALIASIEKKASKILVNERVDVALGAGADGVHLLTRWKPGVIAPSCRTGS